MILFSSHLTTDRVSGCRIM